MKRFRRKRAKEKITNAKTPKERAPMEKIPKERAPAGTIPKERMPRARMEKGRIPNEERNYRMLKKTQKMQGVCILRRRQEIRTGDQ